ncbi:ABC transporter [Streptomyces sp. WAC 06738]|uniref:ABC transporter permease subunit n=1 Tax=Streptomyces sp. WAC 06738 TaxID=2203210 RepID=UPI000F718A23|nr:ATP-binding cassette domain-containing protein [Streptomyces sp. WAC 06738]AZM45282.1 ABC transporter [Streptomyces sp. WAC 06738]
MSLTYELTLAGLAVGSAAALSGIGVVVTYRATGVLNLAHGAVAMVTAYVMRQLAVGWNWPLWAAAAVSLLVVAPGIGLLMGRFVFRPLSVLQSGAAGAGGAQALVASLGVFVLLMGAAGLLWGTGARTDAPELLPSDPWVQLGTAVALAGAVAAVTRWTRFGRELRAVVDNRRLAALSGIDADRVADAGWAFGTFTAGVTGVLLAPEYRLDPYGLPLLVMAVIGVAVAAGLRSLPAVVGVALAVGVAQAQLTRLHPPGWSEQLVQALGANLFAVLLLVAALALPRLRAGSGDGFLRVPADTLDSAGDGRTWLVAGVLFLLPLGFAGPDLTTSVQVPALAVVLLSLVVVTGRGGQVSLGQAAYAGLGALFTALLAAGRFPGLPALPELVALGVAVLLVAPVGLLTGYPAIRRRGLALALVTLAVGVAVSRFVFAQPYATSGLTLGRPAGFTGDRAYYVLELLLLAAAVAAAGALRRGRQGRALAAIRDHESGAAAAGVAVPALKVTAFAAGAALAALGGGMLAMGARAFDPNAFDPVRGLLWFAAVVVLGADSMLGALLASALLVGLDAGTRGGMAAAVIGILAVLLGRFPGGLYEALRTAAARRLRPPRLTPLGLRVRTSLSGAAPPPAGYAGTAPADTVSAGPPRARTGGSTNSGSRPPGAADAPAGAAPAPGRGDVPGPRTSEAPQPPHPLRRSAAGREPPGTGDRSLTPRRRAQHGPPPPDRHPAVVSGAPAAGEDVLAARGISVSYGDFAVLSGVGLRVEAGRVTALVGPNGAGKSTLFHTLAGTLRPRAGRVVLRGRDVTRRSAHVRSRLGLARTFQQPAVFSSLTVAENVAVGAEQGPVRDPAAVDRVLRLLGLDGPLRDMPATDLPTGTLRRVELGRALAGGPHVLLLDEPAAGLDLAETAALVRLLRALAADGMALLVVEHDLGLVGELADTVYAMAAGRIVASGTAADVLAASGAGPVPGRDAPAEAP